ncbi:MAG: hypothetical protein QOK71_08820 [Nitrososphaeraceae archaeon]|jgi:hypothetical protein|nr:hypothetical protein [Nitrososphaeraceae archaeon]
MEKIRTNNLFSSEFDFLQPRTSTNLFLIQNKNTIDKKEEERKNDIQFDIVLDTILSNLNLIKNQIKS